MLCHICNGLVAISALVYLQPTVAHTRGFVTSYRQIQCTNTSMYNQTFFAFAIRLWNTLPIDVCQLPPDIFKAQLNTIHPADVTANRPFFNCTTALFLANVNSRSRSLYAIARPSVVVCLSSVRPVHPTQAVEILGNISRALGTLAIR